jgi:acetyl-CoA acetyltransferase
MQACCGAGGAAARWGFMAVASGLVRTAIVAGVEVMTHTPGHHTTKRYARASPPDCPAWRRRRTGKVKAPTARLLLP